MNINSICLMAVLAALLSSQIAAADLTADVLCKSSTFPLPGARLSRYKFHPPAKAHNFEIAYASGNKLKVVTSSFTVLVDGSGRRYIQLANKTMFATPKINSKLTISESRTVSAVNVVDLHKTGEIAGYPVHLYKMYFNDSGIGFTYYLWLAPDITLPPDSLFESIYQIPAELQSRFIGTPLKVSIVTDVDAVLLKSCSTFQVTALSTKPIPVSVFSVPAYNTKINTGS